MSRLLRSFLVMTSIVLSPFFTSAQGGQTASPTAGGEEPITEFADQDPSPPANFKEYQKKNLQMPPTVQSGDVSGNVLTSFVVEKDGTLSHIEITTKLSPECDAEAVRFLKSMPLWQPGQLEGKAVRTRYSLTFKFIREEPIYEVYDTDPVFSGSYDTYLDTSFKYPPKARRDGTHGPAEVSYVIELDGSITNVEIVKSLSRECDAELARMVWGMPKWKPATRDGKPVRIRKYLKVTFAEKVADPNYPDFPPRFPYDVNEYIKNNLIYPREAAKALIMGKVKATFVVEPDGSITNVKIVKPLSWECDEEVYRLIREMPKWHPASIDGKPVRATTGIRINFIL